MNAPATTVEDLSKAYRIGSRDDVPDTLIGALTGVFKAPLRNFNRLRRLGNLAAGSEGDDILWAVKDVSFEVAQGEVVGIIGRNGAGKSTLLKILSRITEPTSGCVTIRGRVSSLLEVGTGFHPELTGRDNIYMNGTILGMTKREIDRKFDEIVDFSGVEKFLDTPTKRYSSGMQVRLAFAVAAHLEPEILIIDEVLAVGDAEFQRKCLGKMQNVADGGRTVLFVSHNMASVQALCSRCIMMRDGQVQIDGETSDVISEYLDANSPGRQSVSFEFAESTDASVRLESAEVLTLDGRPLTYVQMGEGLAIRVKLRCLGDPEQVQVAFGIVNNRGVRIAFGNSSDMANTTYSLAPNECRTVECGIDALNVMPGTYTVNLGIQRVRGRQMLDRRERALTFSVEAADVYGTGRIVTHDALVFLRGQWNTVANDAACTASIADKGRVSV